ncbi:MAG: hypothetical protein K2K36_08970, partial [Muribaculaceae bacterium]|nr:hypothetical protein [Muribaculaceae bacterium]
MEMRDMSLEAAKAENDVTPNPTPEAAETASAESDAECTAAGIDADPTVVKEDEAVEAEADMDSFPLAADAIAHEENETAAGENTPRHESRPESKEEILQTLSAITAD